MKPRNALGAYLVALGMIPACGAIRISTQDSETHWLSSCQSDEECGPYRCICGGCTAGCSSDVDCSRDGTQGYCPSEAEPSVCDEGGVDRVCRAFPAAESTFAPDGGQSLLRDAQPGSEPVAVPDASQQPSATDGGALAESMAGGWSIRNQTPYARSGHALILDERGDRMIAFGGGGNDTWALPLSGANANQWTQLFPEGEYPPPFATGDGGNGNSAIYDAINERMLVVVAQSRSTEAELNSPVQLWQLSLGETLAWSPVVPSGPSPERELVDAQMVLDREGQRAIVVGGRNGVGGVWALSLDAAPTWSRLADAPPAEVGWFGPVVFDAKRRSLVVSEFNAQRLWSMSLDTGVWELELDHVSTSDTSVQGLVDPSSDRLFLIGGSVSYGLTSVSLATWEVGYTETGTLNRGSRAVLDASRGRIVSFGGDIPPSNAVVSLPLDTLQSGDLVSATQANHCGHEGASAWDPVHERVVCTGSRVTYTHALEPSAAWQPLDAGITPFIYKGDMFYDPIDEALLWFGSGSASDDEMLLSRLGSAQGAQWETVAPTGTPPVRRHYVSTYDAEGRRLLIHGGYSEDRNLGLITEAFDETWELRLDEGASWREIKASGDSPGPRSHELAIYDPVGKRLIVFGGKSINESEPDYPNTVFADLHSLALAAEPTWSKLTPTGEGPPPEPIQGFTSTLYDPIGQRMLLVRYEATGVSVYALHLQSQLTWHHFCAHGFVPAPPGFKERAVLTPDGLFFSFDGGAFRFDLDTPYCD